jgi:hypothetical protein
MPINIGSCTVSESPANNQFYARYLEGENQLKAVCPICKKEAVDYIGLPSHVSSYHNIEDFKESPIELEKLVDPLKIAEYTYHDDFYMQEEQISFGEFFGEILTSEFNQHVLINLIGPTGSGKSHAAMNIAENVSKYVAKKMGGVPEDYFSLENVAIMRLETIVPILKNLDSKRYSVYIFDDIGGEYNARDFMKKQNKELNKIFQTFRDSNTMVIFTMPNTSLIDVVGRKLAHFQIEMNKKIFGKSVTIGKLYQIQESYHRNKTLYPFVVHNGIQYTRIMFKKPSEKLSAAYVKRRNEIRKEFTAESVAQIESGKLNDEEEVPTVRTDFKYMQIVPLVLHEKRKDPKISIRSLAACLSVDPETLRKSLAHIKKNNMKA